MQKYARRYLFTFVYIFYPCSRVRTPFPWASALVLPFWCWPIYSCFAARLLIVCAPTDQIIVFCWRFQALRFSPTTVCFCHWCPLVPLLSWHWFASWFRYQWVIFISKPSKIVLGSSPSRVQWFLVEFGTADWLKWLLFLRLLVYVQVR